MFIRFLRNKSININIFQGLIDPIIIILFYINIFHNNKISLSLDIFFLFFVISLIFNLNGLYESYRIKNLSDLIPKIFFITCSLSIVILFFSGFNANFTNLTAIKFFLLSLIYLYFHHFLIRIVLRRKSSIGINPQNIIFLGDVDSYEYFLSQLKEKPWIGYKIIYYSNPNFKNHKQNKEYISGKFDFQDEINEIKKIIESNNINKIVVSYKESEGINLNIVIEALGDFCIPVSFIPNWNTNSLSLDKENFGDIVALNLWGPEITEFRNIFKRFFDLTFSSIGFILLIPIFILITICIKIDSHGPIIFEQKRYGLKGKIFKMYKFRTLYLESLNKDGFIMQVKSNDKRVTRIGKFLRKYSLDELPQLLNVIKGEMSLVGPRPHAVQHNEYYRKLIPGYMQRHLKIPGITGLAQINGARGETNQIKLMELRIKYDIEYNNNWNLLKDFFILFKTIITVLKGESY